MTRRKKQRDRKRIHSFLQLLIRGAKQRQREERRSAGHHSMGITWYAMQALARDYRPLGGNS